MSYCRFSTDDFRCDFYAYEARDGYHLHVPGSRVMWDPPQSPYRPESLQRPEEELAERKEEKLPGKYPEPQPGQKASLRGNQENKEQAGGEENTKDKKYHWESAGLALVLLMSLWSIYT